ncbi:hypothetical protein N3K66_004431 [Trichothecium roseum]|uniref:Uncharacterized protein n=1 Tax=Trichothecium roseum TaxID=47278 RepID=A0ACC0V2Q3_9HYPO|nr:hypothetical protein N3K66_004431 [Trichothecium roseum]
MSYDERNFNGLSVDSVHSNSVPAIKIMSSPPTPTTVRSTRSRREDRDTGFPEPFNGARNTTLPHPDADLSPNAVITSDDLSVDHAMRHRRLSFIRKHRRTISSSSHGSSNFANPQSSAIHSMLSLVADHNSNGAHGVDASIPEHPSPGTAGSSESRSSREDIRDTVEMDDMTPPSSPESRRRNWFGNKFGRRR